jgi:hypothetical protein
MKMRSNGQTDQSHHFVDRVSWFLSRDARNFVATTLVVLCGYAFVGCSSIAPARPVNSEQRDALSRVQFVALMTPDVQVLRQKAGTGLRVYGSVIPEWSEAARQNLSRAAGSEFSKLFSIVASDSKERVDANLFLTATDEIKTSERRVMDTLGLAYGSMVVPMLYATVVPMVLAMNPKAEVGQLNRSLLKFMWPAGLMTLKMELRDARSGDTLWSFTKESRSDHDLRDSKSVKSLVAEAMQNLISSISQKNDSDGQK